MTNLQVLQPMLWDLVFGWTWIECVIIHDPYKPLENVRTFNTVHSLAFIIHITNRQIIKSSKNEKTKG